ncbi:6044_t:CDS:2, partial [Gigaspora margarita]
AEETLPKKKCAKDCELVGSCEKIKGLKREARIISKLYRKCKWERILGQAAWIRLRQGQLDLKSSKNIMEMESERWEEHLIKNNLNLKVLKKVESKMLHNTINKEVREEFKTEGINQFAIIPALKEYSADKRKREWILFAKKRGQPQKENLLGSKTVLEKCEGCEIGQEQEEASCVIAARFKNRKRALPKSVVQKENNQIMCNLNMGLEEAEAGALTELGSDDRQIEIKEIIVNTREENLIEEWIVEKDQIEKLKRIWNMFWQKIENDLIKKGYKEIMQASSEVNVSKAVLREDIGVTRRVSSKLWKEYISLFFEHIWKFWCELMVVQELQIEERNENGEGCSKKIKVDNIRNQEGELASKKRTFIEEVGKSILDWIKGFLKKTWISESWFKKGK